MTTQAYSSLSQPPNGSEANKVIKYPRITSSKKKIKKSFNGLTDSICLLFTRVQPSYEIIFSKKIITIHDIFN